MRPSLLGRGTESCGRVTACSLGRRKPRVRRGGVLENPLFFRARQAWRRRAPSATRPPLPWPATLAIADWMLNRGLRMEALFVLTCFTTYFRPIRCLVPVGVRPALSTRASGVPCAPASSSREGCAVEDEAVRGRSSVGQCDVPLPWPCPPVCTAGPPADVKHVPIHVSSHIEDLRPSLSVPTHNHACLYRLRHGGCSHDLFHRLRSMAECKKRGRWTCDDSLRRYQKPIALMKEEQSLPRWMLDRHAELETKLARGLQGIPRRREPLVQMRLVPR